MQTHKKSVLYTWMLSYALLLVMILFMCVSIGRNASQQLIDEYKAITQTLQAQTNTVISAYFAELESKAYEICNDYLVNDFVSTPDPTGSKYYNLSPIQQSLSVYALQSGETVSRYLYMANIDRALTDSTIYRQRELYNLLLPGGVPSAEEFSGLLTSYQYNQLYTFPTATGRTEVVMLTSVPLVGGKTKGMLLQVVDAATLDSMMQANRAVEDSTTVLLAADGTLVSTAGDAGVAAALQTADLSAAANDELRLADGHNYWIQSETLKKADGYW